MGAFGSYKIICLTFITLNIYMACNACASENSFQDQEELNNRAFVAQLMDEIDRFVYINDRELRKVSIESLESFWVNNKDLAHQSPDIFNHLLLRSRMPSDEMILHKNNNFLKSRILNIEVRGESKKASPMAQFNLATLHERGWEKPDGRKEAPNMGKAFQLYIKSAERGLVLAQNNLGVMYQEGWQEDGHEKQNPNYEKAYEWLAKAAQQGYALAQSNLALMYEDGWFAGDQKIEPDIEQAIHWYQKAVEQGLAEAQNNLGFIFEKGLKTINGKTERPDTEKALSLYIKAAEQGLDTAQDNITRLISKQMQELTDNNKELFNWLISGPHFQALCLKLEPIKKETGPFFLDQLVWEKNVKYTIIYGIAKIKSLLSILFCKEAKKDDKLSTLDNEVNKCIYIVGYYVGLTSSVFSFQDSVQEKVFLDSGQEEVLHKNFKRFFEQLLEFKNLISYLRENAPGFLTTARPKIEVAQANSVPHIIHLLNLKGQGYYSFGEENYKKANLLEDLLVKLTDTPELESCIKALSKYGVSKGVIDQLNETKGNLRKMKEEIQDYIFYNTAQRNQRFYDLFKTRPSWAFRSYMITPFFFVLLGSFVNYSLILSPMHRNYHN